MSFVSEFNALPIERLLARAEGATAVEVRDTLRKPALTLNDFAALISPAAAASLEELGRRSHAMTVQRFGRVIRLFAPLYLSNECINNCKYCGFSRDNPIFRVTLTVDQVLQEAHALHAEGFRSLLLVAGEHPKFISETYLAECVRAVRPLFPSVSLEIGPMETNPYRPLVSEGAEGLVVYQETYNRDLYAQMHTAGPKRNFDWRLETPERADAAGFRRLGIGALFGLSDWREEAIALAAHAEYLLKHCWKSQVTISLPRLRPNAGDFEPLTTLGNKELAQLICAFRICFPDVGIVLSTREPASLRDGLMQLGVTHMSAGSHTEPGGYTGAGKDQLHHTERGRIIPLTSSAEATPRAATRQFDIADERTAAEVANRLKQFGYEAVWKDWDAALTA